MTNGEGNKRKRVFIVPHSHWDREWYLPFQKFRFKLVELIDNLLGILRDQDYRFLLDGQTIVIEDYLEIRPERKSELLQHIKDGKISTGPWYILPDEWLVGQESLIRNLEYSLDLSRVHGIELMNIAYLPDMFGHSNAIPQLLHDLTGMTTTFLWRGVGPEITKIPFKWKSNEHSSAIINCNYLPFGYGNAASLPENTDELVKDLDRIISDLDSWSPVPIYLLLNGSDHLFPQPVIQELLQKVKLDNVDISIGLLEDYLEALENAIKDSDYSPLTYSGEFRSSARAHLLQDTYSSRMWIKQWNQKVEDLLTRYAEPLSAHAFVRSGIEYPIAYLREAWKWHLRNQPHDSICGCSIDQTHEEMKFRYYWAESIAERLVDSFVRNFSTETDSGSSLSIIVFNPTNYHGVQSFSVEIPSNINIKGLKAENGDF
ncbi:MAG: hypothetical protein ACTSP4_08795 [Candidatus Hodarchaeales archaeon]